MPRRRSSPLAKIAARLGAGPRTHAGHLLDEPGQRLRFSAAIPGLGGDSLLKIAVEAHSEPDAFGSERLRLRAHIQANLASAVRPALAALAQRASTRMQALAAPAPGTGLSASAPLQSLTLASAFAPLRTQATNWLAAKVNELLPGVEKNLTPLLQNDLQTWVELHASTAPLHDGAKSLLPNAQGLERLGIRPVEGPEGTPLQAWSGAVGNEAAQVLLLRLDEKSLPENLKSGLAGKPFQLAAAVVSVATRK